MKTILYATDRAEQAVPVLRYAIDLSTRLGANIVVLQVYQLPQIRVSVTRPGEQLEQHAVDEQKEILRAFCMKHAGDTMAANGLQVDVVCNDSILNGIVEKSRDLSPDLVVIGRKDRHTERGLLVGDIGQGLVKRLSCPVLMVPHYVRSADIKTILYASDFEEADISAIQNLVPIAQTLAAKIHVVHIATKKEYSGGKRVEWIRKLLKEEVDYDSVELNIIFSDDIVKKLNIYSQSIQADLIAVLYREGEGFFQNLFRKGVVTKLEKHISIPLMSFSK